MQSNTKMANALERCSGGRSPLASCNYAIADLHHKSIVYVAGYGFGSPGISTTDVVIGLFYICK